MADPPLPRVIVKLDHPGLPYKPGDKVTGILQVTDDEAQARKGMRVMGKTLVKSYEDLAAKNLQYITIELSGEAIIATSRNNVLVRLSSVFLVSKSRRIAPNKAGEFAFEMEIPRKTEINPDESLLNPDLTYPAKQTKGHTTKFATQREHPLPPSVPILVGTQADQRGSSLFAAVIYEINTVSLKFHGNETELHSNSAISGPFWVLQNSASEADVDALRNTEARGRATIGLQSKKPVEGASPPSAQATPPISCEITFSGPSFVVAGKENKYPIDIKAEITSTNTTGITASQVPLSLISLKAKLAKRWAARTAEVMHPVKQDSLSTGKEYIPEGQAVVFEGSSQGGVYTPQQKTLDLIVRGKEFSDFETINIYISHVIALEATFKCADGKKAISADLPVRVLPRSRLATDQGQTAGFVEGPQDVTESWGPVLDNSRGPTSVDGALFLAGTGQVMEIAGSALVIAGSAACCTIL